MAKRNKKVLKLRAYRDKLIARCTGLEADIRRGAEVFRLICVALKDNDTLRAYTLASGNIDHEDLSSPEFHDPAELAKELTLVYRMLSVERNYTEQLQQAVNRRDYLRCAALAADHQAESRAHDRMLSEWSQNHGIKKCTGGLFDEDVE